MSTDGKLVVHDLTGDGDELRAQVSLNGRKRELAYRLGGIEPAQRVDALAVALLPIAMSRGWSLELPGELSPRLRKGLDSAQDVLAGWWKGWNRVELQTSGSPSEGPSPRAKGVACFFTGGVDSFYSVLTELDRLDAVIFVHGFDVLLGDAEKREQVSRSLREAAAALGLELIEVETNVRDHLTWPGCKWGFHAHGAALASVALLAANRFGEVLIPASHTYRDLYPWGSHALLDPLWSTEALQITHHGAIARTPKVAALAGSEVAMGHLRCCFHETLPGEANCGRCEKCLRTMASLRIVGALKRCATLPHSLSLREIERLPVLGRTWETLIRDLLAEADKAGDEDLARALRKTLRRAPWRARVVRTREAIRSTSAKTRRRTRRRLRRVNRRVRELPERFRRDDGSRVQFGIRPIVLPGDREGILAVLEPEGLHRIPSAEMDDFDVGHWLVAESANVVSGVAGFRVEQTSEGIIGKNLILAVREDHRRRGIGRALVDRCLQLMLEAGATKVVSNSDRPDLISWLIRDYGFRRVGEVQKPHAFGRPDVDRWTTLEAPMAKAAAGVSRGAGSKSTSGVS